MFTDTLNKVTQGMTSHTATKPTGVGSLPSVSKNCEPSCENSVLIANASSIASYAQHGQSSLLAHLVGM